QFAIGGLLKGLMSTLGGLIDAFSGGAAEATTTAATQATTQATVQASTQTEGTAAQVSQATLRSFERQLAQHGRGSLEKSLRTFEKRLAEHMSKLERNRAAGGHTSSVEREIRIFRQSINAIKEVLKRNPQ